MNSSSYSPAWLAPQASGTISATVALPGSKSLTNRELILAALASEKTTILDPLKSRDSSLMIEALRALGAVVAESPNGDLEVSPASFNQPATIDCGLAGTVMRFVPPIAALSPHPIEFDGDEGARRRPMGTTISSLRALGAEVDDRGTGSLPFSVIGSKNVSGGEIEIDASASSQFVSGLMMAAPRFEKGLLIRHVGEHLPSMPHIEMTIDCLRKRGIEVRQIGDSAWLVKPGEIAGGIVRIEPDLSNAGPFLAAAMVAGGSVTIPHWPSSTTQVGDEFDGILQRMGADISRGADGLTVTSNGVIHGIDIDLSIGGELAPVIAALATLADSPTVIRGVAHLRGHETDRLAALATEINRIGGIARETEDGLEIDPSNQLHGALWRSYEDHRMATTGAIIGLRVPGITIENIRTTAKTMPDFPEMWTAMLSSQQRFEQMAADA